VVIAGAALLGGGAIFFVRRLRDRAFFDVLRTVGRERIVLIEGNANCAGFEREGVLQVWGNGCLALSDSQIVFQRWLPRRQWIIPRADVREVDETYVHLGKSHGGRLLRLRFAGSDGVEDVVAFSVGDVDMWTAALRRTPSPSSL